MFGNSVWYCAYSKFMVFSIKKLATFGYIVEVFSHGNLSFISENFNWSAEVNKNLSLSDQLRQGRVLEVSPWRVRIEVQSGGF